VGEPAAAQRTVAFLLAILFSLSAFAEHPAVVRSVFSDLCFETSGAATADGTAIVQSSCDGDDHQVMDFLPVDGQVNVFNLRFVHANKCLIIPGTAPGANAQLAGCDSGDDQRFELIPQPGGNYHLQAVHSGLLLGLASASTAEGIRVEQQTASASSVQDWRLASHDFSNPAVNGRWGDVIPWPHIAVSAANLPDGRILSFSGSERETWPWNERTYSATFDPATGEFEEQFHQGHNMFCADLAMAADGRVFVNGGRNTISSPWTTIFQYSNNQWTQIENMPTGGRWYPTTLALADGDMFTALGTASNERNPERWDEKTGWQIMTGIDFQAPVLDYQSTHTEWNWWPLLHLAPQGKIFHSGPTPTMGWINTKGSGQYEDTGIRQDAWYHKHGASIMYDEGRILNAGGWQAGRNSGSTRQSFTVDLTGPSPQVAPTSNMNHPRKFHNGVMLPDGQVLIVGGNTSGAKFSDSGRVLPVEFWDPDNGQWSEGAELTIPRNYHSIALLLTDGRVLSAGGGYCAESLTCNGASHLDGQIYEPPYLFNPDGSYATRPVIESGPGFVEVGSVFNLTTDSPVAYFSMVKMSATTHAINTDVRYMRLESLDLGGNTYRITANGNPNVMSAGYWMIFAVDANGVPSESHVVRVTTADVRYENLAFGGSVSQSSTASGRGADNAVDGDMTATAAAVAVTNSEAEAWWQIDLNSIYQVETLRLWSRTDCCAEHLQNLYVLVSSEPFESTDLAATRAQAGVGEYYIGAPVNGILEVAIGRTARYIRLQKEGVGNLALAEFQVFGEQPGGSQGLVHYRYFEEVFTALPDFGTLTPVTEGVVDGFSLAPVQAGDGFAIQFYGQLEIPASGTYTFYTRSSDGSRLLIDGAQVVDNDGVHSARERSGSVSLSAGSHDIVVEFFDNDANETLTVSYEGPGINKQEIPLSALATLPEPGGSGEVLREWWTGIAGTAVTDLTGNPAYPDTPSGADVRSRFEAPADWADNYGTRVRGFLHPPITGQYTFWISSDDGGELWLSSDDQPSNASRIAQVPGWSASREWDKFPEQRSASVFLERGRHYYIEALQKEQTGGDNLAVAWQTPVAARTVIDGAYLSQPSVPLQLLSVDSPAQQSTGAATVTANAVGEGLLYSWSAGDGSPDTAFSAESSFTHNYAPGRYTGTVTVRDMNGNEVTQTFQLIVHVPLTVNRPAASSSIAFHLSRAEVWNVNPDNDSVAAIDANSDSLITEIQVGDNPRGIAVAANGLIWVTNKGDGSISVIDPSTQAVTATVVLGSGTQPHGIVSDPAGTAIYVALEATGEIVKLDGIGRAELQRTFVGERVRHLSISADGTRVLASRFVTPPVPGETGDAPDVSSAGGIVEVLDSNLSGIDTVLLQHSDRLASEHTGPGLPNYLGPASISPDGLTAWVPSKQDNILQGQIRNGLPLVHDQTVRAISSKIDLVALTEDFPSRVDHDDASIAPGAVFDRTGAFMYTSLEGNRQIAVTDTFQSSEILRFSTGRAPQGLAISPSGDKLFVHNFMDRSVTVHDLSGLHADGDLAVPLRATIQTVAVEALTPNVLQGKQFFYDASDDRLAAEDYMSCASCHNEGGQDGRTWDFTQFGEGVRNTITLKGRGIGHGRVHWSANFDEIQDFEGQIRTFALGTGLMSDADFNTGTRSDSLGDPKSGISAELDALAAYVNFLTEVPESPYRDAQGGLTGDAQTGRDLFISLNCGACHGGSEMTDSGTDALHDVGTMTAFSGQRMGGPLTGFDTPSLLALNSSGPYLHDGSAATLKDAILAHSNVSVLDGEAESLQSFLLQMTPGDLESVTVAVPDVVGQTQATAESAVTVAGLSLGVIANQNSATVPAGSVIGQDPVAGTEVAPGSAVNLVVSDGPLPPVDVPEVVGLTQTQAMSAITAAGLDVGTVSSEFSDTIPAGSVTSQNPAGGVSVNPGTDVDLIVSNGPQPPVSVPSLVGLDQATAESSLAGAGLILGSVSEQNSSEPAGEVLDQNPVAGTEVAAGTSVDLTVSNGITACSDGLDNDNDGLADFPADPGCDSAEDSSEQSEALVCDDGQDNDGDGLIDYPLDPGCSSSTGNSEVDGLIILNAGLGAGGNDAEQKSDGSITTTSLDLEMFNYDAGPPHLMVGLRYPGITIPQGAIISSAYVQFQADASNAVATSVTIQGQATDNAAAFTTAQNDLTSRARTAAAVSWQPGAWTAGQAGENERTADLAPILQEIVDQPGWTEGNALAFLLTGSGERVATTYNAAPGSSATLHVEYSNGAAPNTAPVVNITAPADGISVTEGTELTFSGTASDGQDGDLGGSIDWSSNLSGSLGGGGSVAATLGVGQHTITAAVTDSGGLSGSAAITVTVIAAQIDVPNVVGLAQASAESAIVAAGLSVGTVTTTNSATVASGNVISQSPDSCTQCADSGAAVDLVVSLGAAAVDVPNVVGQPQATAESNIVAAGLTVGAVTTANSSTVPAGNVISQSPTGCSACAVPGSPVDLVVSLGPQIVDVPNVVGQPQATAESNIVAAGLTVGAVTTANSDTVPSGNVISQSPTDCSACADAGSPVDLVVSLGPVPVDVPNVVGQPQATAESNIVAAGLTVGTTTTQTSTTVAAGSVISQSPAGCAACVAPGSAVDLVISSGPPNQAPTLNITGPADGTTADENSAVTFSAAATDSEDGNLSGSIQWRSNKDGLLGTGASVTVTLSKGRHTITATVADSGGQTDSDTIMVRIRKQR
jgi:YVTN family beta-propeller protein